MLVKLVIKVYFTFVTIDQTEAKDKRAKKSLCVCGWPTDERMKGKIKQKKCIQDMMAIRPL